MRWQLHVFDYDVGSGNDLLGTAVLPLRFIKAGVTDLRLKIQPQQKIKELKRELVEVRLALPGLASPRLG